MRRLLGIACLSLVLGPAGTVAQTGMSQARLEDDCLQRLKPIVPREVKARSVDFYALGNNATYYVVSYRFTGNLETGRRDAACTYARDGRWLRDDAAAHKLARELEPSRRRATAE